MEEERFITSTKNLTESEVENTAENPRLVTAKKRYFLIIFVPQMNYFVLTVGMVLTGFIFDNPMFEAYSNRAASICF